MEKEFYNEYLKLCKKYDLMLLPEQVDLLHVVKYDREIFEEQREEYFYFKERKYQE